jgi:hypothetical protein
MSKIVFGSLSDAYLATPSVHPIPIKDYPIDWFKNIKKPNERPNYFDGMNTNKTIKGCPSFVEIFENGFVIPAPTDYFIHYTEEGHFMATTPFSFRDDLREDDITYHHQSQMIDHMPEYNPYKLIVKLNLPVKMFTPKGYSVAFMRMPFGDHTDFEAIYGNMRTDKLHHLGIQCGIKHNNQILIKQGTPLVLIVPFKREKFTHKIVDIKKTNKYRKQWLSTWLKTYGSASPKFRKHYWSD